MTSLPGFDEVVVGRRSIRGFLDKPVPRELIAEIIGVAMRAPSSFNNQCWNFSVVTGAALDAIRTDAGTLMIVTNYSGDLMNFEMAAEMATPKAPPSEEAIL